MKKCKKMRVIVVSLLCIIILSQVAYANPEMNESAFSRWMAISKGSNRNGMSRMVEGKKMNRMKSSTMKRMNNTKMKGEMDFFEEMDQMEQTKKAPMGLSGMPKKMRASTSMALSKPSMESNMPKKMKKKMRKKMGETMPNEESDMMEEKKEKAPQAEAEQAAPAPENM